MIKDIVLMGYSGHAYVVADIFAFSGRPVKYYCEQFEKKDNPFNLHYLGSERESIEMLEGKASFVAVGENQVRKAITAFLQSANIELVNAIHPSSYISPHSSIGIGVMISASVVINAFAKIGNSVICNTGSIIEHECEVEDFAHIAPGVVLCGGVKVGEGSFIGANTVIKQGVTIGKNVTVGAGSVIWKDIEDNSKVAGNPVKNLLNL